MGIDSQDILKKLQALARPEDLEGMARFGIPSHRNFGVRVPELRKMARAIGKDSGLARELWDTGYRETRIIAGIIQSPLELTDTQVEGWLNDFDSWEITDQTLLNCFWMYPLAYEKALEWSWRTKEFEKRAGFSLMAILAVKDKVRDNTEFRPFLEAVAREAHDGRNFVKKAVNWALRQVGKRSLPLHEEAARVAEELKNKPSRSARWVGSDALRELTSDAVLERLKLRPPSVPNLAHK